MKYMFVCYAEVNRSPTGVDVAMSLARKYGVKNFNAESLGYENLVREEDVDRLNEADIVFAMDQEVVEDLFRKGVSLDHMCNLEIEDCYPVHKYPESKKELERILKFKLEPFFDGSRS